MMYEFEYEVFEFLDKFQKELQKKIFVITNEDSFEFYYTEAGVMFTSRASFELIHQYMQENYGTDDMNESISVFKQVYFTDITEPSSVTKDKGNTETTTQRQPININIQVSEKLKKFDFIMM